MKLQINDTRVSLMGDPHLGKRFEHGVPLDRRGEREERVWQKFFKHLCDVADVDLHVCMGDLFDKFLMAPEIILRAATKYRAAAAYAPDVDFVVLRGNHDAARDADRKSAFDLFAALVADVENIHVVHDYLDDLGDFLFFGWQPFKSAADLVAETDGTYAAAFGHYDTQRVVSDSPNFLPVAALQERTNKVFTGHVHQAESYTLTPEGYRGVDDGLHVTQVGSLEPYAHGEQSDDSLYITLPVEDALQRDDLRNKCVRLLVKEGEEVPQIDCLQMTTKLVGIEDVEIEDVDFEDFDFRKVFFDVLTRNGLSEDRAKEAWEKYECSNA